MEIKYFDFKENLVNSFLKKIDEIVKISENYKNIELKQTGSSNFVFEYDRSLITDIKRYIQNPIEPTLTIYDFELFEKITVMRDHFDKIYKETLLLMDDMFKGNAKSYAFWSNNISKEISSFANVIINVLFIFQDKQDINYVQKKIEDFDQIIQKYETVSKDYSSKIENGEKTISDLEKRLNAVISDRDILSIRDFYKSRKNEKTNEEEQNRNFYYICIFSIILIIIYLLVDFTHGIFIFKDFKIITSIFITPIIGFISFLMLDFRKRMNISKSILDDIDQKNVIIESYSVLMEKRNSISNENKQKYEIDLITSIFANLLSVKNYGYTKKEMQSMTPNSEITNIFEKILDKIK